MNPFFYPYKGGIERRMADTSRLLAAKGHDVTVLTGRLSEDSPEEETMDGYRIVRLKSRQIRVYNPPFISSKGVLEALGSLDADLVNFNYRWAPSYTKGLRKYDGKKVFTYHNMWGEGVGLMGRFSEMNDDRFAPTLETFDHVIAVSDYVRKDLLRRGYSARYVTAVPTCLQTPVEPGEGKGLHPVPGKACEDQGSGISCGGHEGRGPQARHMRQGSGGPPSEETHLEIRSGGPHRDEGIRHR